MEYPTIEVNSKSKYWPGLLQHIHGIPKRLYCRGNLELLNERSFAIVGTRKITSYGKEAIQKIVPSIARHFVIVSGLALGVDAAAHHATLQAGGKAIAVLGGPVDKPAPASNLQLAKSILEQGGLLVSEYKKGDRVYAVNFAIRDRIISGLSKGVLIVEADIKSGSLITARFALEQNRDVFAVPGSIFSTGSKGTNWLIKKGAKPVVSSEDILEEYDMLGLEKKQRMSTADPAEQKILAILEASGPIHMDAIIDQSGLQASDIMATLSIMELKGMVRQMGNGTFRKSE